MDLGVFVSSRTDEDEEFTMNFSSSGKLSLQPVAKKENLRDLTQWASAFHVYMAVYLEKFPQAARSMIQYIKTIRDVDKSGGSWRFYDEQFRLEMARNPHVKWHHHNAELWNKAMGLCSLSAPPQGQANLRGGMSFDSQKECVFDSTRENIVGDADGDTCATSVRKVITQPASVVHLAPQNRDTHRSQSPP